MVKRLKEVFLYPLSDATWLAKTSSWWILYVFYLTIPVIALHFKAIVQKTIEEPDDDSLPDVAQTVKGWGQGMKFILGALGPLALPTFYLAIHVAEPYTLFTNIAAWSFFVYAAFLPAVVVALIATGDGWVAFKPTVVLRMIKLNVLQYLGLVAVPAMIGGMFVGAVCVTPIFLVWLPAAPILGMAYARALGLYYRGNALA